MSDYMAQKMDEQIEGANRPLDGIDLVDSLCFAIEARASGQSGSHAIAEYKAELIRRLSRFDTLLENPTQPTPAFPCSLGSPEGHQDGPHTWQFPGLTKRELFAAMAMQGMSAGPYWSEMIDSDKDIENAAIVAVKCANALLAELAKGGEK